KKYDYKEVPTGYFQITNDDFSNQIAAMEAGGASIITGTAMPRRAIASAGMREMSLPPNVMAARFCSMSPARPGRAPAVSFTQCRGEPADGRARPAPRLLEFAACVCAISSASGAAAANAEYAVRRPARTG